MGILSDKHVPTGEVSIRSGVAGSCVCVCVCAPV